MKNYKIKASFRVSGIPGGGMSDKEETHDMVLSQVNVNRIREWLAKHYGVGPHDVGVSTYTEVK
jgi:hypothetical protein